jgi:hypothetical protein
MATLGRPKLDNPKQLVSIRMDQFVLDYFKQSGPGHLTRINAVLAKHVLEQEEAPELTEQWFKEADAYIGDKLIRKGER